MLVKNTFMALLICLLVAASLPNAGLASGDGEDEDWIQQTGDILQIALPIIGGGATFFTNPEPGKTWDKEGTTQFVKAYGLAWGSTYFIKILASKARPNGANRTSFPSGHTMSAFAGAAFIDGRFGRTFGIPAYVLAGFTGYSRVHSGWHYRDDVMAGASIGMMSNWLLVSPLPGKIQFIPTVDRHGYGVKFTINGGGDESANNTVDLAERGVDYHFGFGPAFVINNTAGSKGPGESHFQLSDLEGFNDPTTTAVIRIGVPVSRRGGLSLAFSPFEARDQGSYSEDVKFGGALFPAGTPLDSAWRFYELMVTYDHKLLQSDRWGLIGSIGAGMMYSYATLATQGQSTTALVDDRSFYPYLGLTPEYQFGNHWALETRIGGMIINDDWIFDAGGMVVWRPNTQWDVGLGYNYFSRKIETDSFYNKVNYHVPHASVSRYW